MKQETEREYHKHLYYKRFPLFNTGQEDRHEVVDAMLLYWIVLLLKLQGELYSGKKLETYYWMTYEQ